MTKIVTIADSHLRTLKFHNEYRTVFKQIFSILKQERPDYIIHLGDLVHAKNNVTPELIDLTTYFLKSLAAIAPTYLILGNHDLLLKNLQRQDAISPIVNAINDPNLVLLKYSTEVNLKNDICLNVLSICDQENWKTIPTDKSKINIALFHGGVNGAKTDTGFVIEDGEADISLFDNFDYAFLGDIHVANQSLNDNGKIRYTGSTVQQNFAESDNKGILVWEIKNKNDYKVRHIVFPNPIPFVNIHLDHRGEIPKYLKIKQNSRIRIISEKPIAYDQAQLIKEQVQRDFKPNSISTHIKNKKTTINKNLISTSLKEDLRNPEVQNKFLSEYLKNYGVKKQEIIEEVCDLNKKFNKDVQHSDAFRNIRWKLLNLKWSNLYNYGRDNQIDFSKIKGIVGIFGKNFSGKSSIYESLLFTLFNSSSKGIRKNLNIINQNQIYGEGEVEIDIDGQNYRVSRSAEKYEKQSKTETTTEARTSVEFFRDGGELNGASRLETDKNIKSVFGNVDDYLMTNYLSQFDALNFVNQGSTKRKEILTRFLDLNIFDEKHKLVKNELSEIKGVLKKVENVDFDTLIAEQKTILVRNEKRLEQNQNSAGDLKNKLNDLSEEINDLQNEINSIPKDVVNIKNDEKLLKNKQQEQQSLQNKILNLEKIIKEQQELNDKCNDFLEKINVQEYKNKKKQIEEKFRTILKLDSELKNQQSKIEYADKKVKLLQEVPCGNDFPNCKFIKDAHQARNSAGDLKNKLNELQQQVDTLKQEHEQLNPKHVSEILQKYDKVQTKKTETFKSLSSNEITLRETKNKLIKIKYDIEKLEQQIKQNSENNELAKQLDSKEQLKLQKEQQKTNIQAQLQQVEREIQNLYKVKGSAEEKQKELTGQRDERARIRKEFQSLELLAKALHPSGISFEIIKSKLPEINLEIKKILSSIVEFDIFLEADDNKLEIYIQHPKFEPRPLEGGSGAEKTLASIGIRIALINSTALPVGNVFVLDEPVTSLDETHLSEFHKMLDVIKSSFDTVLLISHLDVLKDMVDSYITIDKDEHGYSRIK